MVHILYLHAEDGGGSSLFRTKMVAMIYSLLRAKMLVLIVFFVPRLWSFFSFDCKEMTFYSFCAKVVVLISFVCQDGSLLCGRPYIHFCAKIVVLIVFCVRRDGGTYDHLCAKGW
jgi:hypothetical protein